MQLLLERQDSPVGTLLLVSDGEAVRALDFLGYKPRLDRLLLRHYGPCSLMPPTEPSGFGRSLEAISPATWLP